MTTNKTSLELLEQGDLLFGHTNEGNAVRVDDYPYGYTLRCSIRYWIETHAKLGDRFVSQTTNPKRDGEVWNKPKKSTYAEVGVIVRDPENGHITWVGLGVWPQTQLLEAFDRRCRAHLNPLQLSKFKVLLALHRASCRRDADRLAAEGDSRAGIGSTVNQLASQGNGLLMATVHDRRIPYAVVRAHAEYEADGGTLSLADWLTDWEIRRSNTPGGLIGDPWPEGPGYHPATPLPGGGYD